MRNLPGGGIKEQLSHLTYITVQRLHGHPAIEGNLSCWDKLILDSEITHVWCHRHVAVCRHIWKAVGVSFCTMVHFQVVRTCEGIHFCEVLGCAIQVNCFTCGLSHSIDRNKLFFTMEQGLFHNCNMRQLTGCRIYD